MMIFDASVGWLDRGFILKARANTSGVSVLLLTEFDDPFVVALLPRESRGRSSRNTQQRNSMSERFDCLTHVYRCFLSGSRPSLSAADVAGVVCGGGASRGEDRARVPAEERGHDNSVDVTCISVSLVEMMTCLVSQRQPEPAAELTQYCVDTLTLLLQDMDLMTQLVHHFQSEDQIVSHLAAKCASTCVVYQLLKSGTVSPVWQQKCVQAFLSSPPAAELDACLWSLTDVLKRLLKAAHQEILWKLVALFDSSLSALCSKFLHEDQQPLMHSTSSRHWGTTFCLLLDLLEALTASSFISGAEGGLENQRLAYIHSSALLTAISCSSEYFVKKRALLLLKRLILQKAGEDWASEDVLFAGQRHDHFRSDMNMLAQTVLTAVTADWLQSVQVGSVSFFGGTRHNRGDDGQKPDCVMLRGVSLLLLKSMELQTKTAGRTEQDSSTEVYGYLQSLWGFLRRCSVQLTEVSHLCCWVSLLFGEQDDDMMEAAKALLSIFLHHRLCSGLEDLAELEAACSSGCNPHCHFLLLLRSVSFDHSTLLDFLISSETCFLEYFVRYLKYLKADWQGFTAACERDTESHCHVSLQESLTRLCGGDKPALTFKLEPEHVESSAFVQPTCVIPPVEGVSLGSGLRLVEYDSSDESDPESMEICEDEPGASVKQERGGPPLSTRQKQYESCDSTGYLSEPKSTKERRPEGLSPPSLPSRLRSCTLSGQGTCETLARVVACLSELREVVTRLQTKKLFPYNPSSLLKILAGVEICSQQSPPSQFNK
ncbi:protein Lines homolog 1 isoform X2 [Hippoglossus stenolepis]|uniref:protein Lines homolog 1 isoform X2 n=1 Tax=Hippoglossus stenolepis TaxID=195615 RepID=UPI00159CBA51|nr:protein Lines homolog 1 isoform X2 [Hippoglossus stenolepis]